MPRRLALLVSGLALASLPTIGLQAAPTTTTTTAEGVKHASNQPSRKTCRPILKTGSRLGEKKICKTVEEWTEYDKLNKRDTDEAINRTRGNCGGPTSGCE